MLPEDIADYRNQNCKNNHTREKHSISHIVYLLLLNMFGERAIGAAHRLGEADAASSGWLGGVESLLGQDYLATMPLTPTILILTFGTSFVTLHGLHMPSVRILRE